MKSSLLTYAFLPAFLFACATPQDVMFDSTKRDPTASVDVFREGNKPTKSYKEIGEVSYEDFGGEEAHAMRELILKAKRIGANGIIMLPRQDTGYNFNAFGRSGNKYLWKAVAVVYE